MANTSAVTGVTTVTNKRGIPPSRFYNDHANQGGFLSRNPVGGYEPKTGYGGYSGNRCKRKERHEHNFSFSQDLTSITAN